MNYTKEEVVEKLIESYKICVEKYGEQEILINQVIQTSGFKADEKSEIFKLFGVSKYEEIVKTIPNAEIIEGEKHNQLMKYIIEEKSEEKQMENTNTKNYDRIEKLLAILKQGLYEKDEAIRLALLTAISGESIFFLGAPGCAKSMITRRIKEAFKADDKDGVKYFETLLNQFTTPEDIFGNISLRALNGDGESGKEEYKRITDGFLPQADIAFLDEIWKASPAIQNTLLTIINERKFHNGGKVEDVPLKALFAASNELPTKNEGLEALYDRFILRLVVDFIQNEDSFFEMIDDSNSTDFTISENDKNLLISNEDLENWRKQIDKVKLSEESKSVISAIRKELTLQNEKLSEEDKKNGELFEVGDRRWKKIVHILKTAAFLNDRSEVDLMDCSLIENCIWGTEKQQKKAKEIVEKCIKQNGLDCDTAIEDIQEQIGKFDEYLTEMFYEENPYFEELVTKEIDGCDSYKIDYDNQEYWINRNGLYDFTTKERVSQINSFNVDKDNRQISCQIVEYGRWVSKQFNAYFYDQEFMKSSKVFDTPDLLELRQSRADKEKYTPIKSFIDSEIKKLDNFANEMVAPYKANLFANQEYCDVIMNAVTEAKEALQNTQVELDKKRSRYQ